MRTPIVFICLALFSNTLLAESSIKPRKCEAGSAGPYSTLAILTKKSDVSAEDFYSYWRDVHGMLATRIPGFWTYRQYHLTGEINALQHIPEHYSKPLESVDGIADVSFCSSADIAGLAASPQAELIKQDERNLFSSSYLYGAKPGDSLTVKRSSPVEMLATTTAGNNLIMLLAKSPEESQGNFRQWLLATMQELQNQCPDLQRLRLNIFQPYDASAWLAPDVNHIPAQVMDASAELQFTRGKSATICLLSALQKSSDPQINQRYWRAFAVNQRYALVVDGQISLLGLRGLPALQLIDRVGASNQKSNAVLQAVYGDTFQ